MLESFISSHSNFRWTSCLSISSPSLQSCLPSSVSLSSAKLSMDITNPLFLVLVACAYLTTLFALSRYMGRHKEDYTKSKLFTYVCVAHNLILSIMSLLMNAHITYGMYTHTPKTDTICIASSSSSASASESHLPSSFTYPMYLFLASKLYELLDTVILVLRRRDLSLLHVWHHCSVMLEVWAWIHYDLSLGVFGMWFNTAIHVAMYLYYACALVGVRSRFKKLLTLMQIVQFVTSLLLIVPFALRHRRLPHGCMGLPALLVSAAINSSYLVLFVLFYKKTYSQKKMKEVKKKQT